MKEFTIRNKICGWLNSLHGAAFEVSRPNSKTGKPDITGCYLGHCVAFEVKIPGKKARRSQGYALARLKRAGAHVAVVTSLDEAKLFMNEWF